MCLFFRGPYLLRGGILIYQAGFEVYNSLQGILPLSLFILCTSGVSASLFMHSIPRNSFLIHLHPQCSSLFFIFKYNYLLSPGGAVWSKRIKHSFPPSPHRAVVWPAAVTEKSLLHLDSQYSHKTTSESFF